MAAAASTAARTEIQAGVTVASMQMNLTPASALSASCGARVGDRAPGRRRLRQYVAVKARES